MKHFGRSLLNPTLAAARRDFSAGPLLEMAASRAEPVFEDRPGDSAMRLAFRKARAAGKPSASAGPVKARAGARRA